MTPTNLSGQHLKAGTWEGLGEAWHLGGTEGGLALERDVGGRGFCRGQRLS